MNELYIGTRYSKLHSQAQKTAPLVRQNTHLYDIQGTALELLHSEVVGRWLCSLVQQPVEAAVAHALQPVHVLVVLIVLVCEHMRKCLIFMDNNGHSGCTPEPGMDMNKAQQTQKLLITVRKRAAIKHMWINSESTPRPPNRNSRCTHTHTHYLVVVLAGGCRHHSAGRSSNVGLAHVDGAQHQALVAAFVAAQHTAGPAVVAALS